ncbi:hypothetical protein NAC44_15285 [Allorhizobium sp. BGMRC 0089]|uniref:hypothetical protein n=1 Tax=Allorhizobium sonneratiae TaxID=2934936 RepID=UPI002034647E|nr:hypothetical protein [Allorhizobium sonneratiae]MCM2293691.1 hypothetical protein [Allorhizobium sonneratiae]
MTQILSVSATTAGYVADTLKPPAKVMRPNYVEQISRQINIRKDKDAAKAEAITRAAITTLTESSALGLFFMKAGENEQPRAGLKQTRDAYDEAEALSKGTV